MGRILDLYADLPAAEFGVRQLKAFRHSLVRDGLARTYVNDCVGRLVRMFRWAAEEERTPPEVFGRLRALRRLQPGRSGARETAPRQPVAHEDVVRANGVVDLRTGNLLPHAPDYLMTVWLETLDQVFDGHDVVEVIDYLHRAIGYSLTGLVCEEVFFMLWGDGRNGKGTIVGGITSILGSYARTGTSSLFLAQKHDASKQFEIADLAGARVVVASEVAAGRYFDTAVLKNWTGGDRRKGCHKHRPYFEYPPMDKLWLQTNDKLQVASWDTAFQERCRLIPFENAFTREKGNLDSRRKEKLQIELPGVLAWAVRGAVRYIAEGLSAPRRVIVTVEAYRDESTRVGEFLAQNYLAVGGSEMLQSRIYKHYRDWSAEQGFQPVVENRFGGHLKAAGYKTEKSRSGKVVLRIGLREGSGRPVGRDRDDRDDRDGDPS